MSQQRGGFCLDASTMGLSASKPPVASPRGMQQQQQQQQQHKNEDFEERKEKEKEKDKEKDMDKGELHSTDQVPHIQCNSHVEPLPTKYFSDKVQKLSEICGCGAKMNFEMNSIFLRRLASIDEQGGGDSMEMVRLVTFQDWVDQLLHVNYIQFDNMTAMELEAFQKIMGCYQSTRGEQEQTLDQNRKLRKDICAITKFVQDAYHCNNWNTSDLCLETMEVSQLLGTQECRYSEPESEKAAKNIKSLVNEVAAKHDEVCQLQSQLAALDEFVQTARQKIILKDKCIEQLNKQLEDMQATMSNMTKDFNKEPMTNQDTYIKDSDMDLISEQTSSSLFQGLNKIDQKQTELLNMLKIEFNEFIDLVNKQDFSAIERRRMLLFCIFEKMCLDCSSAERNLDYLRSQLKDIEFGGNQLDEPIADSTRIHGDKDDIHLMENLRSQLQSLEKCNQELYNKYQHIEGEYKAQLLELETTYKAEHSINEKNCQALKEIADLLSKLSCSDLSYKEIYTETSTENPFCSAIMDMYDKLSALEKCKAELRLSTNINEDCPHRQQLEHTLLHCQTQSKIFQATRDNYLSIIVEFQRDLEELTEQVEQQQQQQHQQELQHNELISPESEKYFAGTPEVATHELQLQNEHLVCQIQSLQNALGDREDTIQELRTVVNGYGETTRLKDEISALKQRNTDQAQKLCDIARLLEKQEDERQKLGSNYENLMNTMDDQCKELRRANRDVQSLRDRLNQEEKTQEDLRKERNLLREEIIALKDKEAKSAGRERALTDQLKCRQIELEKSRTLMRDMHNHLKQEERQHKETVGRLCQANEDVRSHLQAVSSECKEMQHKLKQQASVTEQQQLIIDSFRKWKDAQLRSDDAMRKCIRQAEEHINALLEENQRLAEEYRRLYNDYCVLEIEMRRIKNAVNIRLPSGCEQPEVVIRGQKVHEEMINRLKYMRATSQRLSEQVKILNSSPKDKHSPSSVPGTSTSVSVQRQEQQPEQQQHRQSQQQLTLYKSSWKSHRPH